MPKLVDLTQVSPIGDWTILAYQGGSHNSWACRCVCGRVRAVPGGHLRSGRSRGCGCRKSERIACGKTRHGHSVAGRTSLTYHSWRSMLARCLSPNNPAYRRYGACGVQVHLPWQKSFAEFLSDVGERPSAGHTLDRYPKPGGNYEPGNVRWATATEQANNRGRYNHRVTISGVTLTLSEWARRVGLPRHVVKHRLRAGWPPEEAVSRPVDLKKSRARTSKPGGPG